MRRPNLQKRCWKLNVVYLYQFNRSPVVPNLSPYCLKLETFLRANNLKYEHIGSWTLRSKAGKLPFIELNGEQIFDSQLIIWHLMKHFQINEHLSAEQAGIARAVERLVEGSVYYAITYFRAIENGENSVNPNISGLPIPRFLVPYIASKLRKNAIYKLKAEGIGMFPREMIIEVLKRDLQALDAILGDKKFIIGVRPTIADYTLYGHIACAYYLPFRQPITDLLDDDFPRIRMLLERIRAHYWSDFNKPGILKKYLAD